MPSAHSSISSSERRPFLGLLAAGILLASIEVLGGGRDGTVRPASIDDFDGRHPPEFLLIGDSTMASVRFGDFGKACTGTEAPLEGLVWFMSHGSPTALMESLITRGITPEVLVVGLTSRTLDGDVLEASRSRVESPKPLEVWGRRMRSRLAARLYVFPDETGPKLASRIHYGPRDAGWWYERPRNPLRAPRAEDAMIPAPAGRDLFAALRPGRRPAVTPDAVDAAVRALRTLQARGARVLLARMPVPADIAVLEASWGLPARYRELATRTGCPLLDLNGGPAGSALQDSILDGIHVEGEAGVELLSSELGKAARSARPPPSPAPPSPS